MNDHIVAVVVPSTFAVFELGVAVEAFANSARPRGASSWYTVKVCTAEPGVMTARHELFSAHIKHGLEAVAEADTVLVPEAMSPEAPAHPDVLASLQEADRRGTRLVSFCSGAFVLAAAGVLDGRVATTHWKYAERLATDYPRVKVDPGVLYIEDEHVYTSAGTAAGIDLSLHLIRKDHGAAAARSVARSMVVPPHREGGQAQFLMTPLTGGLRHEGGVQRVLEHALANLHEDLSVSRMASLAHMSPRQFSRRFRDSTGTTPSRWLLMQRLTRARELLEETDHSIDQVAALAGFGSAVTLRYHFAQSLHTSPSAYRRAFRHPEADEPRVAS